MFFFFVGKKIDHDDDDDETYDYDDDNVDVSVCEIVNEYFQVF